MWMWMIKLISYHKGLSRRSSKHLKDLNSSQVKLPSFRPPSTEMRTLDPRPTKPKALTKEQRLKIIFKRGPNRKPYSECVEFRMPQSALTRIGERMPSPCAGSATKEQGALNLRQAVRIRHAWCSARNYANTATAKQNATTGNNKTKFLMQLARMWRPRNLLRMLSRPGIHKVKRQKNENAMKD